MGRLRTVYVLRFSEYSLLESPSLIIITLHYYTPGSFSFAMYISSICTYFFLRILNK